MNTIAMRTALGALVPGRSQARADHPGLLLDRYLAEIETGTGSKPALETLYRAVSEASPSALYQHAYTHWRNVLGAFAGTAGAQSAVQGRLIVGLGAESVRESSISLHRAWGVPVIPGSALKGLARRYLERHLADDGQMIEYRDVLFGSTERAGYVSFFDAWYVPDSAPDNRPLALDTITVHHPRYYNAAPGARREPWDFDDPTPISFLSARGSYLVAVRGPDERWTGAALDLLTAALSDWGVGAKTSSGYGRLHEVAGTRFGGRSDMAASSERSTSPASGPAQPATPRLPEHPLTVQVRALRPNQVRPQVRGLFDQWRRLSADEPARRQIAEALAGRLQEARLWGNADAWVQDLRTYLVGEERS